MASALVELDRARVERYARQHHVSIEDALPRLLDEVVAAAERAGRQAVEASEQKLLHTHAKCRPGSAGDRDRGRPISVLTGNGRISSSTAGTTQSRSTR